MRTAKHVRVSEEAWLRHLASPQARVTVAFGEAPGRLHTPPLWNNGPRQLPEHLVYFFAQGSARAEIAGNSFLCARNSCCWITPGTTFRFYSDKPAVIWRFRFSLFLRKNPRPVSPARPYYLLPNAPAIAETVHAMLLELSQERTWRTEALRSWLIHLAILFFRGDHPEEKQRTLTAQQQDAIYALMQNRRPDEWPKPRDLAKATGLSPDYFSRVFQRSHGLSPRKWIVRQRLSYAVVLLQETPLRIGEIAQQLGYVNLHLFSRQFSACFGQSPKSFRK